MKSGNEHYVIKHWSHTKAEADYKNKPATVITVNDRAATREAIIAMTRRSGMEFIPRSDWAAHKNKPESMQNDWNYSGIAIHTAGRSYSCGPAALQLQKIQELHLGKGWPDIGYHYAIDCFGNIYEGRDIRFKGTHLSNYNTGNIGIVLLENLMEPTEGGDLLGKAQKIISKLIKLDSPTVPEVQAENLVKFISVLREFFDIKHLGGHREFPRQSEGEGHTCPGNVGLRLVNNMRRQLGLAKP